MSFCKRRCKGTAIFSNHQIIPYYIIYFFVGLYVSSIIFSKTSCLGGRNNKSFKSLNELATLKQHFAFRCSDCSSQSETQY